MFIAFLCSPNKGSLSVKPPPVSPLSVFGSTPLSFSLLTVTVQSDHTMDPADFELHKWWEAVSPAPESVSWVRRARAQLVLDPVSRSDEALQAPAPVPAPQVGTAAGQQLPVPVPDPRVKAPVNQFTPAPIPTPWVGAAGVLSAPGPVPVPEVRPARIQPASAPLPTPWVGAAMSGRCLHPFLSSLEAHVSPSSHFPCFLEAQENHYNNHFNHHYNRHFCPLLNH